MKNQVYINLGLIFALSIFNCYSVAKAEESKEIKTFFAKPPVLVNTTASEIDVWSLGAKYYFTITVPEDAGTSLQKVVITQRRGVEDIRYQVDQTFAFIGKPDQKGETLNLQASTEEENIAPITINFIDPIPPGTTFTIGLVPKINPGFGDTYLFGITVFPVGANSQGLYLGVGRIAFRQQNPFPSNSY